MTALALIRASSLTGYRELVTQLGGTPDALLRRCHINPTVIDDESRLYPLRSFVNLLELTATALGCPNFGLRLAAVHGSRHLGPLGIMGLNSSTVGGALDEILEHLDFHSPAVVVQMDMKNCPGKCTITWDFLLKGAAHRTQIDESAVGNIYQELMILTQGNFAPEMVLFRHSATTPALVYRKYFHAPVFFEQDLNGIVVNREVLKRELTQANPQLHKLALAYVRETTERQELDIVSQVKVVIKQLLPTAHCGIEGVAEHLCIHERTLQRKLKDAGVLFEGLLDAARRARASELLKHSSASMARIAELLGYTEQASFNRACQRWFGTTPTRVRLAGAHAPA